VVKSFRPKTHTVNAEVEEILNSTYGWIGVGITKSGEESKTWLAGQKLDYE